MVCLLSNDFITLSILNFTIYTISTLFVYSVYIYFSISIVHLLPQNFTIWPVNICFCCPMILALSHSWLLTHWYLKVTSEVVVTYGSNGPQAVRVYVWISNERLDAKFGILLFLSKAIWRGFQMGSLKRNAIFLITALQPRGESYFVVQLICVDTKQKKHKSFAVQTLLEFFCHLSEKK